jgi:hypothetical protein
VPEATIRRKRRGRQARSPKAGPPGRRPNDLLLSGYTGGVCRAAIAAASTPAGSVP